MLSQICRVRSVLFREFTNSPIYLASRQEMGNNFWGRCRIWIEVGRRRELGVKDWDTGRVVESKKEFG